MHVEDDWVCNKKIQPSNVLTRFFKTSQLLLAQKGIHQTVLTGQRVIPLKKVSIGKFSIPNILMPQFPT